MRPFLQTSSRIARICLQTPGAASASLRRYTAHSTGTGFFLLWSLFLTFPYFILGPYSFAHITDENDSRVPWSLLTRLLDPKQLTGYIPHVTSGADALASNIFHPVYYAAFAVLPDWAATAALLFASYVLSGLFTFLLLRRTPGIKPLFALLGGILYSMPDIAFASLSHFREAKIYDLVIEHATLPLMVFLCILVHRRALSLRLFAISLFVLGLAFGLVTHFAVSYWHIIGILLWCLIISRMSFRKLLLMAVSLGLGCALIQSPYVLSTLATLPTSARQGMAIANHFTHPEGLIICIIAGLIVARIVSMSGRRGWPLTILFLASLLTPPFVYAAGNFLLEQARITGGLESFRNRFDHFQRLATIALLAGLLPEAIRVFRTARVQYAFLNKGAARSLHFQSAGEVVLFLLIVIYLTTLSADGKLAQIKAAVNGSNYFELYHHPQMEKLKAIIADNREPFRVATATAYIEPYNHDFSRTEYASRHPFLPMYAQAYGLETADGINFFASENYRRFWGLLPVDITKLKSSHALANSNEFFLLLEPNDVYGPNPSRTGCERASAHTEFSNYFRTDLMALANIGYVISPYPIADEKLVPLSGVPDSQPECFNWRQRMESILRGHYEPKEIFIYKLKQAASRFFCVTRTRKFQTDEELDAALKTAPLSELLDTAFVAFDGKALDLGSRPGGSPVAKIFPNRVDISFTGKACALIASSTPYSKQWTTRPAGGRVVIDRAYEAFMLIRNPDHLKHITLKYRPAFLSKLRSFH